MTEAAKALGFTKQAVSRAIAKGRLARIGTGPTYGGRGVPCVWQGKRYPTIAAAARETGTPYRKLWDRIDAGRFE